MGGAPQARPRPQQQVKDVDVVDGVQYECLQLQLQHPVGGASLDGVETQQSEIETEQDGIEAG